jgi:TolB-like protein/Tfp pilus assembly protein PilF
MAEARSGMDQRVRFGVFEVDFRAGELRKGGMKIKLHGQPLEVLAMLLERPGEVVTREEIRQKLWPAETFVDFDHGLNKAVTKLREALGDDADNPRFIETLPRRGYRFLVPIDRPESRSVHSPIRSVAVLPLANLSGDPEQEYFADGMTDALITDLGKISALRVISRTSVMRYKGTKKPAQEIAQELDVDAILEGTVIRAGDRVRVSANLIQASPERHLWAESYERDLRDVLALQGDVARAVAREIEIKLTPRQQAQLGTSRPVNPEAYEDYLKGRFFLSKFTREGEQKALGYFQQAIEKDPGYARAYAGMSTAYTLLTNFGVLTANVGISKAKSAAAKAIEIDSAQNEAYSELGWIKMSYDWDFPGAEKEFQHAIELNPNFAPAHEGYSMLLAARGRFDESLAEMKRARDLDPLSLIINTDFCAVLYFARRYDLAIAQCNIALEIDQTFPMAHLQLAKVYQAKGMYEEAQTALLKEWTPDHDPDNLRAMRKAYVTSGWTGFWQKGLDLQQSRQRIPWSYARAVTYANLGKKEQALHWLEKAYEDRFMLMIFLKVDPTFDALHPDPRFQELLRRIGLPP